MPLVDVELAVDERVPSDIRSFIGEAARRIERFQVDCRFPAFVPSNFNRAYAVLRALAESLPRGSLFCEWGSGFGVVTCLAAMLDFEACGIEIESDLVESAQQLAYDFDVPVEFVCGSFITGADFAGTCPGDFAWLKADAGNDGEGLGLTTSDFDVVFTYPWPDEEHLVGHLFECHAGPGAVLISHHGGDEFRVRRKANLLSSAAPSRMPTSHEARGTVRRRFRTGRVK
jgi:hypothetical protein